MSFLVILAVATALAWLVGRRTATNRDHARLGLAIALIVAGVSHFANTEPFVQHLPDSVPGRESLVYLTGVIEIALGLALLRWTTARRTIGRIVAAYLVAVLPANIYVAIADIDIDGQAGGIWRWVRLPLQALFIAWALWSTTPTATPASADSAPRAVGPSRSAYLAEPSPT